MSVQISKDCTRLLVMSEDETKEKIAKLVGLNKFIMRGIKAKIDNYVSPLSYKQTGCPLKINERTEGHLKRIIRKDPVDFYDEINMESAKLDVFVCIETLRSYVDQLAFKSYRAAHKPRLTARHRKSRLRQAKEHLNWTKDQWRNVVWPDESCFCMEGTRRVKGSSGGDGGAMTKRHASIFWPTGFILGLQMSRCIRRGILSSKRMVLPVIQVVMLDGGRRPTKSRVLSTGLLKALI
ncbi:hypothetical protein G6F45_005662 [Rhizopus arrhizus]|nr:hypothetical protein G6F45_005662 [Rhizopus arrhizus]